MFSELMMSLGINDLEGMVNEEKQIKDLFITLTQGLVTLSGELLKVRASLTSLEIIVAGILNPANSKDALQHIRDQDQFAQTLAPSPEIEQVRLMLDTLKKNPFLGQA
jgi:hypothetical protein